MKAIRYYGPKDLRLEDIPEPVVGPGQVKIKIAWCGICGSDLHMYEHNFLDGPPTATEPHPTTGETLPVGVGHEFSGTIVELGPAVDTSKYAVGQNVAVEPVLTCNKPSCICASINTRNLCPQSAAIGISGGGGGLSEYVVIAQELAHILPENLSQEIGALVEPLAVAWRAVKLSHVKAGDKVLILGAGPIGVFVLKVAQYSARPGAETLKATGGRGADVVVDCAGSQSTLDTALKATRPGGTIMNVAGWTARPVIDMNLMLVKELILATGDHPELIQALADGKFDLDELEALITRRVALEEYLEKGLGALLHEKDQHVKVLIHP